MRLRSYPHQAGLAYAYDRERHDTGNYREYAPDNLQRRSVPGVSGEGEVMRENFDSAFDLLMDIEGYISNDPRDKGGYTKYGIAKAYNPDVDFDNLTKEKAKEIYLERYWKPAGCDELQWPWDVALFAQYVNMGAAKQYMADSNGLMDFFMKCLEHYATRNRKQREAYLTGWCNRLIKLWKAIKKGKP
jgi:hypothetical protein